MCDPSEGATSRKSEKPLRVHSDNSKTLKSINESSRPSSSPRPASTDLLRLPYEIRLPIYSYCIPQNRVVEVFARPYFAPTWVREESERRSRMKNVGYGGFAFKDVAFKEEDLDEIVTLNWEVFNKYGCYGGDSNNGYNNSIFILSKQISDEALDFLYGENLFKFFLRGKDEEIYSGEDFTEANRRRIRYLHLITSPPDENNFIDYASDVNWWPPILANLKLLRLVAEEPHKYSGQSEEEFGKVIDKWLKWLEPYLKLLNQHISDETVVKVYVDGGMGTGSLIRECLPRGYEEKRRRFDNYIFKRDYASIESGYWEGLDGTSGCLGEIHLYRALSRMYPS